MNASAIPLLKLEGVSKVFPGVRALDSVDFELAPGEVHVLLGENGAGKSTLIKVVSGAYQADDGAVYVDGRLVRISSPIDAIRLGISTIYQEFNLAPHLTVAENLLLGRERVRNKLGRINWPKMFQDSSDLLKQLEISDIDPHCLVGYLSVAQQRLVEIAKALSANTRVLIMDEPTACLTRKEIEILFRVLQALTRQGISIIYISHRLEEVFEIGNRVTILRDGRKVGTYPIGEVSREDLVKLMIGKTITRDCQPPATVGCDAIMCVERLSTPSKLRSISFRLHRGEILGVAGLLGSGRSELVRAIFGADPVSSGSVLIKGVRQVIRSPRDAIVAGVGLLTEDRKGSGLALTLTVKENITLASLDLLAPKGIIRLREETEAGARVVEQLGIKTPGLHQKVAFLSGGNQQKVVFAKWLCRNCDILLFDEPTKGIDVGAKQEVYDLIRMFVESGGGVIMISSELSELSDLCHRVLIIKDGTIVRELKHDGISEQSILEALVG